MDHHTAVGDFQTLVIIRSRQLKEANGDASEEEQESYREQVRAFKEKCAGPGVRVAVFGDTGSGAFVTAERASFLVQERWINFDWADAQRLLHRADSIADQAAEWWPRSEIDASSSRRNRKRKEENDLERRPHVDRAYNLLTAVLSAVNQEYRRTLESEAAEEPTDIRSDAYTASISVVQEDLLRAEALLDTAAQRRAQLTYTTGMLIGVACIGFFCLLLGAGFFITSTPAKDGVALLAGGVGAFVSVLQRMTTGSLRLDAHAGAAMLFRFGALRPAIGAVMGIAVAALFAGGVLPAISMDPEQEFAFYGAVGFIAGFNERFAQDVIANSKGRLAG